MKKIFSTIMALAMAAVVFTGCSKDDPYVTAGPNDEPRILQPNDINNFNKDKIETFKTIKTNENFKLDIIVTPADHSTVLWWDRSWNDEPIAEGLSIDEPLFAGTHLIEIEVTTDAGKTTSRSFYVKVLPCPEDPAVDEGRSRWLAPGAEGTMGVKNFDDVVTLMFGDTQIPFQTVSANEIKANVPAMAEGKYLITATKADGKRYACDSVRISTEEYVPETIKTIWNGEHQVEWNDAGFDNMLDILRAEAKEGYKLHVHVSETPADYHVVCAVVDWANIETGLGDPNRGDTSVSGDMIVTYELNADAIRRIQNGGRFGVVGFGCKVTKIQLEAPEETTVYTGPSPKLTWTPLEFKDDAFIALGLETGKTVTVYYTADEGAQGAITTTWWNDINTGAQWEAAGCKQDLSGEGKMEYLIQTMEFLNVQGFAVVGNGFVVNKITVK